jgi:RNA ligase (TIGR02306 family)
MGIEDFNGELDWIRTITSTEPIFLTKELGITYYDPEDNKRKSNKSNPNAKYQRMMNRHPKLAKSRFGRWCMKHTFAKKLLYLILGGDKKNSVKNFPSHIVKTDEERVQNCFSHMHSIDTKWIVTEKRDGTSTTMSLKGHGKKQEYFVCSRNVVMTNRKDGSWYDVNVYTEMADKYNIKKVLEDLLTDEYEFVTIQGETFGEGIQKRDYGLKEHVFEAFNVIFGYKDGTTKRLNPIEMKELMDKYNVPTVPIVATNIVLPDTCEEVLAMASGEAAIYGGMREGLVFRSLNGVHSFKAVDNEFLVKYHG